MAAMAVTRDLASSGSSDSLLGVMQKSEGTEIAESILYDIIESIKPRLRVGFRPIKSPLPERVTPRSFYVEERKWYDLYISLQQACHLNKTAPIPAALREELEGRISQVICTANEKELLMLLQMLSTNLSFDTKRYFVQALNRLRGMKPDLNQYFKDEDPIITPSGVALILRHFEQNYDFDEGFLSVLDVNDLAAVVEGLLASPDEELCKGFVVYNPPLDPHLTPVFIQKKAGKIQVFITDSKGHDISSVKKRWDMCEAQKKMINHFKYKYDLFENIEIYSLKELRQRDEVSCSTFSVLDLKNLYEGHKAGRDIFEFLTLEASTRYLMHEIADDSDLKLFEVNRLPPEMMKVTQSLRQLERYISESPSLVCPVIPVFTRRSPTGEKQLVLQTVDAMDASTKGSISYTPGGYRLNKYIERRRLQMIMMILLSEMQERLIF